MLKIYARDSPDENQFNERCDPSAYSKLNPGKKNTLDALCERYSVDNSDRNIHGALLYLM